MLKYKVGDLTQAPDTLIAHGCNAKGVMGSGVAKAIKAAFPVAYQEYAKEYINRGLILGDVVFVYVPNGTGQFKIIANCITQLDYGREKFQYCDYNAIRKCMKRINKDYAKLSVALPKIGTGLGGGNWSIIEKIIEEELTNVGVTIYVLDKSEIPEKKKT